MATATKKAPAKKAPAVAKQVKAPTQPKKQATVAEVHVNRNQQGREIQDAMTARLSTVEQLAERTGFSVARVQEHVNYEISKNRSKLNGKKQVVVISQPKRRG